MPKINKYSALAGADVSTQGKEQKGTLTVNVDGLRLTIEIIVACCHIVSALLIWFAGTMSTSVSWSLLTLCITTFNTLIQFQNEAQWKYRGNFAFNIPFWGIIIAVLLIVIGFIVEPFSVITQHRIFVVSVSALLTIRQILHAVMIYKLFIHKKGYNS